MWYSNLAIYYLYIFCILVKVAKTIERIRRVYCQGWGITTRFKVQMVLWDPVSSTLVLGAKWCRNLEWIGKPVIGVSLFASFVSVYFGTGLHSLWWFEAWELSLLLFASFAYYITELTSIAGLVSFTKVNYLWTCFPGMCGYNLLIPLIYLKFPRTWWCLNFILFLLDVSSHAFLIKNVCLNWSNKSHFKFT